MPSYALPSKYSSTTKAAGKYSVGYKIPVQKKIARKKTRIHIHVIYTLVFHTWYIPTSILNFPCFPHIMLWTTWLFCWSRRQTLEAERAASTVARTATQRERRGKTLFRVFCVAFPFFFSFFFLLFFFPGGGYFFVFSDTFFSTSPADTASLAAVSFLFLTPCRLRYIAIT